MKDKVTESFIYLIRFHLRPLILVETLTIKMFFEAVVYLETQINVHNCSANF